ncbi:hypothetical protein PV325_012695 [Microctonus aethiopoides]|nr:hypothetical protein PV325_012695 [Microctonus aethiopoides]
MPSPFKLSGGKTFKRFERKIKSNMMDHKERKTKTPPKRRISTSPLNTNFPNSSERTALPPKLDITPPENTIIDEIPRGNMDSGEISILDQNIIKPPHFQVDASSGAKPKIIDEEMLKKRVQINREKATYREYRRENSDSSEEEVRMLDGSRTKSVTIRNRPNPLKEKTNLNQESQLDLDYRDILYSPGEPRVKNMNQLNLNDLPQAGEMNSLSQPPQKTNIDRSHILHPNNIQNFNHSAENPVQYAPQNQLSRASHSAVNENVHYGINNNARHDNNYSNEMRQTYPAYTGYYPYIPQTNAYPSLPPYNTPQNQFNNYPEVPYNNIDYSHNPINENNQQPVHNHVAVNYPNVGEPLNTVHLGHYNPHTQQNFLQNTPHQGNSLLNPQVQNVNTYSANRRSRYHSSYLIPQSPGAVNAIRKVREWRLTFPTSGLDPVMISSENLFNY